MARFRLMNKSYPALEFDYDLESHVATRIVEVIDAGHAPLGLFDERGRTSKRDLNYWWRHRAIPASREQVERLLENLRLDSTLELAERSFGLSLSDRYWISVQKGTVPFCTIIRASLPKRALLAPSSPHCLQESRARRPTSPLPPWQATRA